MRCVLVVMLLLMSWMNRYKDICGIDWRHFWNQF